MASDAGKLIFKFGPYVPLLRSDNRIIVDANGVVDYYTESDPLSRKLLSEILPGDSILDAPSMVVPLLLKKKTLWPYRINHVDPPKRVSEIGTNEMLSAMDDSHVDDEDDVQVVKVIETRSASTQPDPSRYTKNYVRTSVVNKLSNSRGTILAIPEYKNSSVDDTLTSIGLSLVNEFVLQEEYRKVSRKLKKGLVHLINEKESLKASLSQAKAYNRRYRSQQAHRCSHCSFKSDMRSVLEKHMETPHRYNNRNIFICNWCDFKTKDKNQIIFHTYMVHSKRSHIEKPIPTHCCRYCDYGTQSKVRYNHHINICENSFDPNSLQSLADLDTYTAITPKLITQQDIQAYESALRELRLAAYNPHQIEVTAHNGQNNIYLVPMGVLKLKPADKKVSINELAAPIISNPNAFTLNFTKPSQTNQMTQTLMASGLNLDALPPNKRTVLQHPKQPSAFVNGIFVVKNAENLVMPPVCGQQSITAMTNDNHRATKTKTFKKTRQEYDINDNQDEVDINHYKQSAFVVCEICDTYVEGLPEFKNHMLDLHKVKVQNRVNVSRPPLNCQKCQWRFYTDIGLERHLLGAHGLITATMQDKVDNKTDSGRCTLCGRMCASSIVAHMKDYHKLQLKPAQLSYKCKVCSATYGLYQHFENHVYRVHSCS